jgi:hypothetical protein
MWPNSAGGKRPKKVVCDCGVGGPTDTDEAAAIAAYAATYTANLKMCEIIRAEVTLAEIEKEMDVK